MKLPFSQSDYGRRVANAADLTLRNRYFEENPSLTDDGAALLARPGLNYLTTVGSGPIRGIFTEPGAFGGDLFVASYDELYRVNTLMEKTLIQSGLFNPDRGAVSMAIVQGIGDEPERLFFADGRNFFVYDEVAGVQSIAMPDDIGVIDLTTIASYVVVIPVQEGQYTGRFYWIAPGEITVDTLDWATAEAYPDAVLGARRFGDQFWLPGEKSTEVWYPTGDPDAPMQRLQGAVFDRGTWEATAVAINETLIVVDFNGGVFAIRGGGAERVSNSGLEEQIRKAIQGQQNFAL